MSLFDSAKSAGVSAVELAKTFGENLKEETTRERSQKEPGQPSGFQSGTETNTGGPAQPDSFVQRGKQTAQQVAGTVLRAAEKTLEDESFENAKQKATDLVGEVRTQVEDKVRSKKLSGNANTHAESMNSRNQTGEPGSTGTFEGSATDQPQDEIVDGEVLSVEVKEDRPSGQ